MSLGCACSHGRQWPSYDTVPEVRCTVVVENRDGAGCTGAHGLAIWVELPEAVVLLDTGPDPALLAANAMRLGLDLALVDAVVLSHGHDDHTGGLPAVVAAKRGAPLCIALHPDATRPRFSRRTGQAHPIGMPPASQQALEAPGVRRLSTRKPTGIVPGAWASGSIPRVHPDAQEAHLVLDAVGRQPDPLTDDQALVIDTMHGLVVICGCAHAGLHNTLDAVTGVRPGLPIAAVVGGLHLASASADRVAAIAGQVRARGVQHCAFGHCTGESAERSLSERLDGIAVTLQCGTTLRVP